MTGTGPGRRSSWQRSLTPGEPPSPPPLLPALRSAEDTPNGTSVLWSSSLKRTPAARERLCQRAPSCPHCCPRGDVLRKPRARWWRPPVRRRLRAATRRYGQRSLRPRGDAAERPPRPVWLQGRTSPPQAPVRIPGVLNAPPLTPNSPARRETRAHATVLKRKRGPQRQLSPRTHSSGRMTLEPGSPAVRVRTAASQKEFCARGGLGRGAGPSQLSFLLLLWQTGKSPQTWMIH